MKQSMFLNASYASGSEARFGKTSGIRMILKRGPSKLPALGLNWQAFPLMDKRCLPLSCAITIR